LTAIGFSRRKPEKLFEARRILKKLNLSGLDSMPLAGCLDLLLADIDQASARFSSSSDEKLRDWLNNYPGNKLEGICIFCKNWLENDVLVGYRDIESKEVDLDSWFEDREIQEFIEKLEKKSKKITIKSNLQNQKINKESSTIIKDFDSTTENNDERRLPWPGGIKQDFEKLDNQENKFNEEIFKNKSIDFYKYLIEKIAELKFSFGEFLKDKQFSGRSTYRFYIYAFLILFSIGIGLNFLKNNTKESIQDKTATKKPLLVIDQNQKNIDKDTIQEIQKKTSNQFNSKNGELTIKKTFKEIEITTDSPSLEEIRNLINIWLQSKSNYLSGKGEINLSNIVGNGLIDRTIEERQNDIKKGIYKEINSQIRNIYLKSQTSSRIVVVVELNYFERIIKNSGDLINETSLNPLKVKYILGFSNKSWKLVDFISGL
jgi:hypothetical protein